MKTKDAILFFESLKTKNSTNKEIKIYNDFIALFNNLQNRSFNTSELSKIESELEILDLKADTNRKVLFKKLTAFLKFLEEEFSLIRKSHYTNTYMIIGMCSGIVLGLFIDAINLSFGMLIGMVIGLALGTEKDKKAKNNNRVIDDNSN